jgi:HK97 family phage portal protein
MTIQERLRGFFSRKKEPEQRGYIQDALGSFTNSTVVTPETALTFSAVYAAIRVISETISSLPLNYYQRTDTGRELYTASPLFYLMHSEPNTVQTKYVFFETFINSLLCYGNGYAYIERNQRGLPYALKLLHPDDVKAEVINEDLIYEIKDVGKVDQSSIIHVPDMTLDGINGRSRIAAARDNIALGLAAQKYGKQFFESGAKVSGALTHPATLGADAMQNLSAQWNKTYHSGIGGTFKTAILEEGMTYKPIQLRPDEAQFLTTREFSILEIARVFRIPPHMLADLSRATFSNIEHQAIEFTNFTIRPLITKIEQELNKKLIFENEKGGSYFEFNLSGLLRGDAKARSEYYAKLFSIGVMSQNEIRQRENLNSIGTDGDGYYVPMNLSNTKNQAENESE